MPIDRLRALVRSLGSMFSADRGESSPELPAEVRDLLPSKRAARLRTHIEAKAMDGEASGSFAKTLLAQAQEAGWPATELEKLQAYVGLYADNIYPAYEMIVAGRLAESDYDMLAACVHRLYMASRFEEGYGLLMQFKPDPAGEVDWCQFKAYAGYLALASGRGIGEAVAHFDSALDRGVSSPLLAVNAYPIYFEAGMLERADQARRLIHDHYADDPEAQFAVASIELARDYYPEAFRLAECRYRMPEVGRYLNRGLLDKPRWQRQSIDGKTVLVFGEQGLGDIVMCARYLPMVQRAGAKVVLVGQEVAFPLLAHSYPDITMVAGDLYTPVTVPFDYWTGAMSLPHLFDSTAATIPSTAGYLRVPPEQADYWHSRVADLAAAGTPRIGVAWSGSSGHRSDKRRSIAFDQFIPNLRANPGINFFALQTKVPADIPENLVDMSEELVTLADTAALIQEMDLIITVDTSIVHIAGALGKPTWLLLPSRYEYRWGLEGEANNWYDSVRVLRQSVHGDWAGVLEDAFGQRLKEAIDTW